MFIAPSGKNAIKIKVHDVTIKKTTVTIEEVDNDTS
jgi:hypothetical protein